MAAAASRPSRSCPRSAPSRAARPRPSARRRRSTWQSHTFYTGCPLGDAMCTLDRRQKQHERSTYRRTSASGLPVSWPTCDDRPAAARQQHDGEPASEPRCQTARRGATCRRDEDKTAERETEALYEIERARAGAAAMEKRAARSEVFRARSPPLARSCRGTPTLATPKQGCDARPCTPRRTTTRLARDRRDVLAAVSLDRADERFEVLARPVAEPVGEQLVALGLLFVREVEALELRRMSERRAGSERGVR